MGNRSYQMSWASSKLLLHCLLFLSFLIPSYVSLVAPPILRIYPLILLPDLVLLHLLTARPRNMSLVYFVHRAMWTVRG